MMFVGCLRFLEYVVCFDLVVEGCCLCIVILQVALDLCGWCMFNVGLLWLTCVLLLC